MALTVTSKIPNGVPDVIGGYSYLVVASVTFDSSYATGGETLTAGNLGFPPGATIVQLNAHPAAGYLFEYDYTNAKLKAYTPLRKFTGTLDPASLATVTARDDTVTMTGVLSTDEVVGGRGPDTLEAKLVPKGFRASAADTITVRQDNPSAASIDAASGTWSAFVAGANMAGKEVANAVDLSAVTTRVIAIAVIGV